MRIGLILGKTIIKLPNKHSLKRFAKSKASSIFLHDLDCMARIFSEDQQSKLLFQFHLQTQTVKRFNSMSAAR